MQSNINFTWTWLSPLRRKDKAITLGHASAVMVAHGQTIDSALLFQCFLIVSKTGELSLEKVEWLWIVPPVAVLLAKSPLTNKYDLSKVKDVVCGAAPIGKELEIEVLSKPTPEAKWAQAYGMTEDAGITHLVPVDTILQRSIGYVVNNTEVETGKSLGSGQPGELMIRGPQVMLGYLDNAKTTRETLTSDKWQHTGDVGYYTENGIFYIVDRIKELIKYKGYQVAPAELEAILLGHPAVADVCVIGVADMVAGELPGAYVVKKLDQGKVSPTEIRDFVADKVAPYKKLRGGVRFVKEVPKSPSGKLLRRLLRDKANTELEDKMNGHIPKSQL